MQFCVLSKLTFVQCVFFLFISLSLSSEATLYQFGRQTGDSSLQFDSWNTASQEIELETALQLFGGFSISKLWINSYGSASLNRINSNNITLIHSNVIMAPFFSQSQQGNSGAVFYRQIETGDPLLNEISLDVLMYEGESNNFTSNFALVVTWDQVASPNDTTKVNSFQLVLTTDSIKTYLIFNYESISWTSAMDRFAAAGIYAAGNRLQSCSKFLEGSGTMQMLNYPFLSNIMGSMGRFVLDLTEPLNCSSGFTSSCGEFPKPDRGLLRPLFRLSNDDDVIGEFYLEFTCKQGLVITPNVTSQNISCVYDSDYYDYTWKPSEVPNCIDLNSTFKCLISIELNSLIEADSVDSNSISRLLTNLNVTDVLIGEITINQTNVTIVEVELHIPAFIGNRLCNAELSLRVMIELNATKVSVNDETDKCLQACLCRNLNNSALCMRGQGKPMVPPDACCGPCGDEQKAYSTSLKACCNNNRIYDPTKSVCCPEGIRKGNTCPTL